MELLTAFVLAFGGNAALLAALAFFGNKIVGHRLMRTERRFQAKVDRKLQKSLETHRADLQFESGKALAALDADLKQRQLEHQVRFSGAHLRKAEAIEEVNLALAAAIRSCRFAFQLFRPVGFNLSAALAQARSDVAACFELFEKKRIYLPEAAVAVPLEALLERLIRHVGRLEAWLRHEGALLPVEAHNQKLVAETAAWDEINGSLVKGRRELEATFRRLVGIEA